MTVSVTVPNSAPALKLAAEFLDGMAKIAPAHVEAVVTVMGEKHISPDLGPVGAPTQTVAEQTPQPEAAAVSAPEANSTAPEAGGGGIELDKRGIPWDERIHSRGRSLNADGTWRMKRGVDDDLVRQVEAEYIHPDDQAPAAPAPAPAAPPPAPAPAIETKLELVDANGPTLEAYFTEGWTEDALIEHGYVRRVPATPAAPAPAPAPAAPAAPAPAADAAAGDAPTCPTTFLPWVMGQTTAGKFTVENVAATIVAVMGEGKTMADVAKQPDQIPAIYNALIKQYGA